MFRVVLWYLLVSPWSGRTHLRVWLVYDQIGGVTSWYQSRLPVGCPLSNSLAKVESSHWKTFTNIVVWLTGPHLNRVVLGSFIPHPYSRFWSLFSFGLKILLTISLGPRDHIHRWFASSTIVVLWSYDAEPYPQVAHPGPRAVTWVLSLSPTLL